MQGQVLLRAEVSGAQRGWDSAYSSLGARDATNSRGLAPEPTPPGRPAGGRMETGPQRGGHRLPAPHGVGVGGRPPVAAEEKPGGGIPGRGAELQGR